MPRCNHKTTRYDWGRDASGAEVAIARWCLGCGARLSLGPSNDEPAAVQLEMLAAIHLGHPRDLPDAWDAGGGMVEFGFSDRIPEAWSWDISRSLAEQFAEVARADAAADRLIADVAAHASGNSVVPGELAAELAVSADSPTAPHIEPLPDAIECAACTLFVGRSFVLDAGFVCADGSWYCPSHRPVTEPVITELPPDTGPLADQPEFWDHQDEPAHASGAHPDVLIVESDAPEAEDAGAAGGEPDHDADASELGDGAEEP